MGLQINQAVNKAQWRYFNRQSEVALQEVEDDFHLEIQDSGYVLTSSAANLINHVHDFFITDDAFQELCRDNGISYSTSQSNDGNLNVTYIKFPAPQEEIANRNIEQLFH